MLALNGLILRLICLTCEDFTRQGRVLHFNELTRLSLQMNDARQESHTFSSSSSSSSDGARGSAETVEKTTKLLVSLSVHNFVGCGMCCRVWNNGCFSHSIFFALLQTYTT